MLRNTVMLGLVTMWLLPSAALAQMENRLTPIGSAALVNNGTAMTHAWYVHTRSGAVVVCSSIANLQFACEALPHGDIPIPSVGERYRGMGVSSIVATGTAMTQAWYVDELTESVYVCSAVANLKNARCVNVPIPIPTQRKAPAPIPK